MIVCAQCNGNGACIANNQLLGVGGLYTEKYPNGIPAIPCTQCNGKGYQTFGNGA